MPAYLVGDVPAAAAALAEAGITLSAGEFFTEWDPREFAARPPREAWAFAERAHEKDGRARCVLPSSIGFVVYPLKAAAKVEAR